MNVALREAALVIVEAVAVVVVPAAEEKVALAKVDLKELETRSPGLPLPSLADSSSTTTSSLSKRSTPTPSLLRSLRSLMIFLPRQRESSQTRS